MEAIIMASTYENGKTKVMLHFWRHFEDYCPSRKLERHRDDDFHSTCLFSLCRRRTMDFGEWQWIIVNSIRWWLQLHLLLQIIFLFFWSKPAHPGTSYAAIDLVNFLFSLYLVVKTSREVVFLQPTRPAIYLHCPIWVIYQYFSPMS